MLSRRFLWASVLLALAAPAGAASQGTTHDAWIEKVRTRLTSEQVYPRSAQLRGETCSARVKIDVGNDGVITGHDILQPCNLPIFNLEIDRILTRVKSLAPPPSGAAQRVIITFVWG